MDSVYRGQKHIYDLTRKYFLLGRDRMIRRLNVPTGCSILELGCGTGRNLVCAARAYPDSQLFGLDISSEMIAKAQQTTKRAGCSIQFACADASSFDPQDALGQANFDRIFISYALSMIPAWEQTIEHALNLLAPRGSLHLIDFGQQEHLPAAFRSALFLWLRRFHVTPRERLLDAVCQHAFRHGATAIREPLFRGYAWSATVQMA